MPKIPKPAQNTILGLEKHKHPAMLVLPTPIQLSLWILQPRGVHTPSKQINIDCNPFTMELMAHNWQIALLVSVFHWAIPHILIACRECSQNHIN